MRRPLTFSSKLNFGSALYKLASHSVDSALVLDSDTGKIQCTLTTRCVADFWFTWCQQGKKMDRSLTLGDLQRQYGEHSYKVYRESDNVSFSIFSSLLTPLMHCQAVLNLQVVHFDKFLKTGAMDLREQAASRADKASTMGTIAERTGSYSDTESDSDSDSAGSEAEKGSRHRKRASTLSGGESDEDSDEDSEEGGRRRKGKKKQQARNKSIK